MPSTYFIPLPDIRRPVRTRHLHAALSAWFDGRGTIGHHDTSKPYSISPITVENGPGVRVHVLTETAERLLLSAADQVRGLVLGSQETQVGVPRLMEALPWRDLAAHDRATAWRVAFLTPFVFRTGNRHSPFPLPSVVLRAPYECWKECVPTPMEPLTGPESGTVWVSDLNVATTAISDDIGRPGRTPSGNTPQVLGAIGSVTYRCDDPAVAPRVAGLFRLAPFSGVGSYRGKGMGVVEVERLN